MTDNKANETSALPTPPRPEPVAWDLYNVDGRFDLSEQERHDEEEE